MNNLRKTTKDNKEKVIKEANEIYKEISEHMNKGFSPSSKEVQLLIKKHHAFANQFHISNKDVYKALAEVYLKIPEFRDQLDHFHPKLSEFMSKAMVIFAEKNL
jgi:hypothetical protein